MSDAEPDLTQILKTVRDIVTAAIEADEIAELTPRIVRTRTEEKLSLPSKILDGPVYKAAISKVIKEMAEPEEEQEVTSTTTKKRKSADKQDSKKPTKQRTKPEQTRDSDGDEKPKKKPRTRKPAKPAPSEFDQSDNNGDDNMKTKVSKAAKPKKSEPLSKVKKTTNGLKGQKHDADSDGENAPSRRRGKAFLSAATIESDDDVDIPVVASTSKADHSTPNPEPGAKDSVKSKSPTKSGQTEPASDKVAMEADNATSTSISAAPAPKDGKSASANKSESEMSILNDGPPKRKRKTKGKTESKSEKTKESKTKELKKARSKKPVQELSKDEETIKRLKSFVVACGVRKAWSKEFKDLDEPSLQINRLKEILSSLGMTGRMTLEQAKNIKAKREFAQELEDVRNFEQSVVGGSRGRRSSNDNTKPVSDHDDDHEDESDEDAGPPRKRINARNSIMAFLGDQSDDE